MSQQRAVVIERNIWASPVLFVMVAWVLFKAGQGPAGWLVYGAGWLPALGMLGWCAARRRAPGIGAVVGFGLLLVLGGLFWLNHG
ncbi:hypothetical protein [Streptomyces sp. NPDC048248]|uniref:hypothetical protein n=1 Tax=Streptomyces sp. NPDC048248 TaxID=3365523 RepID=UPI00371E282A